MKKQLKQNHLFKKLKNQNVSIKQYIYMLMFYNKETISEEGKKTLGILLYNNNLNALTSHALTIINNIEDLFITPKKIKLNILMGDDYKENINNYIEHFPTTKLPNGKYARSNIKNIETNFKWFFENYEYSWENIQSATQMYVSEYRANNYMYMRTALYFIRKNDGTKTIHSDLADYCDKIINNIHYTPQKYFKTKIL